MYIPDKNYFSIGEASKITGVKPHTLRYWESEFRLLQPAKRESGQRRYVRKDIELIERIKQLLYENKYTISGAKRKLFEERKHREEPPELFGKESAAIHLLKETKHELKEILKILEKK